MRAQSRNDDPGFEKKKIYNSLSKSVVKEKTTNFGSWAKSAKLYSNENENTAPI